MIAIGTGESRWSHNFRCGSIARYCSVVWERTRLFFFRQHRLRRLAQCSGVAQAIQRIVLLAMLAGVMVRPAGAATQGETSASLSVASNSWLECVIVDVLPTGGRVQRLAPPGACPGHYDIRPDEAMLLTNAQVVVLFKFQKSLAQRLREFLPSTTRLIAVDPGDGLCIPNTYAEACRQVHAELLRATAEPPAALDRALSSTLARMDALARSVQLAVAPVRGTRVIASEHQSAFCRWLGLEVVATWRNADSLSAPEVAELFAKARSAGVACVVANLQESGKVGESLAERLNVPLVVFSNFPAMTAVEPDFDALVRHNVERLVHAVRRQP